MTYREQTNLADLITELTDAQHDMPEYQYTIPKSNPRLSFSDLQIGDSFESNGSTWVKKSSRTAYIFGMPHRWFYFSAAEAATATN